VRAIFSKCQGSKVSEVIKISRKVFCVFVAFNKVLNLLNKLEVLNGNSDVLISKQGGKKLGKNKVEIHIGEKKIQKWENSRRILLSFAYLACNER
jgi:hypothetical protein